MFTSDSRYAKQPVYTVTLASGAQVSVVAPAGANPAPIAGYGQPAGQGRLDLVAAQYLNAPGGFWRLCDANNSMVAAALAARTLIGIPAGGAP
jgi:hypothetical protein